MKFSILLILASYPFFLASAQENKQLVEDVSKELISNAQDSNKLQAQMKKDPGSVKVDNNDAEDVSSDLSTSLIKVKNTPSKDVNLFPVDGSKNKVAKATDAKPTKILTNDELLEKIKLSIKPVKIKETEKDISIQYGMPHLNLDKGNASTYGKKLNLSVSDDLNETTEFNTVVSDAYKAALVGQIEASIVLYKKALEMQPDSLNVMYAIATLYHKLNQFSEAKQLYTMILSIDSTYQNALNNYLVVLAEESPTKALAEFKQLEKVNPSFSPVQAQIGMVYAKLSEYEIATEYLKRAVMLSPEVFNYRYNLAVLFDKMGRYQDAIILYKQLLAYENTGETLPASAEYLRSRVNHLVSKTNLHD